MARMLVVRVRSSIAPLTSVNIAEAETLSASSSTAPTSATDVCAPMASSTIDICATFM